MSRTCLAHIKTEYPILDSEQKTTLAFLNPVQQLDDQNNIVETQKQCAFPKNSQDVFDIYGHVLSIPGDLFEVDRPQNSVYSLSKNAGYPTEGSTINGNDFLNASRDGYLKLFEDDIRTIKKLKKLKASYMESNDRYYNSNLLMTRYISTINANTEDMARRIRELKSRKEALLKELGKQQNYFDNIDPKSTLKYQYSNAVFLYNNKVKQLKGLAPNDQTKYAAFYDFKHQGWREGETGCKRDGCDVTTIYTGPNQSGTYMHIETGTNHDQMGVSLPHWNDKIASVCVPAGVEFKAYQHNWGDGQSWSVKGPVQTDVPQYMLPGGGHSITSFRVRDVNRLSCDQTTIYSGSGLSGNSLQIPTGTNHDQMGVSLPHWNDRIASVCVPAGVEFKAYQHNWGEGDMWTVNGPIETDVPQHMRPGGAYSITSFRVRGLNDAPVVQAQQAPVVQAQQAPVVQAQQASVVQAQKAPAAAPTTTYKFKNKKITFNVNDITLYLRAQLREGAEYFIDLTVVTYNSMQRLSSSGFANQFLFSLGTDYILTTEELRKKGLSIGYGMPNGDVFRSTFMTIRKNARGEWEYTGMDQKPETLVGTKWNTDKERIVCQEDPTMCISISEEHSGSRGLIDSTATKSDKSKVEKDVSLFWTTDITKVDTECDKGKCTYPKNNSWWACAQSEHKSSRIICYWASDFQRISLVD